MSTLFQQVIKRLTLRRMALTGLLLSILTVGIFSWPFAQRYRAYQYLTSHGVKLSGGSPPVVTAISMTAPQGEGEVPKWAEPYYEWYPRFLRHYDTLICSISDQPCDFSHVRHFGEVKSVSLHNLKWFDDAECQHLSRLSEIRELIVYDCPISDVGVSHIAQCEKLEYLNLSENKLVTDESVKSLLKLAHLRDLRVSRTGMTKPGIWILHQEFPDCIVRSEYGQPFNGY